MDVSTVKNQIKTNTVNNFYIFTGEEIELMNIYIQKIAQCRNSKVIRIESVSDIYNKSRIKSFLSNLPNCYVVRDDKEFMTTEKAWNNINNVIGNNILIFLVTVADKRSKFCKYYKDTIVEFTALKSPVLAKYIKQHINLNATNCEKLITICENNYSRILLEIDKIKQYAKHFNTDSSEIYNKAFNTLLEEGTIYYPPKDAIFDFVDAVLRRKRKLAFDLLQQSYDCGENTLVLLSVLYTNTKQLLQVQSCNSSDIQQTTGLTTWQIKCAKEKTGSYQIWELVRMLKIIRQTEKRIKTGEIEDNIAVSYVLVNIL